MPRWRIGLAGLGASAALFIVTAMTEGTAVAYPQWQLTTGSARCNECHYAPAGGGLITNYGRDAIGEELSTFEGNGGLLHGKVTPPPWLAAGADVRGAFVANGVQDPSGPTVAAFPMQADVSARVAIPKGFSVAATLGYLGQIRSNTEVVPNDSFQPNTASSFISREHYVMWQPAAVGPYVRAGRFYAPFGLRFLEHIFYTRRDLGFDELQETYNVSGGWSLPAWELHLTAFAPDFVRHMGSDERGFAAYYERRLLSDRLALAAQGRIADAPGATRYIWGGVGKFYLVPLRTLFLGELDVVHLSVDGNAVGLRTQMIGLGGFSVLPVRGLIVTALGERYQQDVAVRDAAWTATDLLVNWFPYPHVEAQVMGRLQFPAGTAATKTLFAQLHYFF
ncbi:MAG TPA: hypothetical protein VKQ32_19565 [Polyangia bacterium]|nr:hypothetical protein [Polyangia bacterium]